jgi:hypothetical protein
VSARLTQSSLLMCPHGGTVTATTTNNRVNALSSPVLRSSDTFLIAGCPFFVGPSPHPCMTVQWLVADLRSKVAGDFTLSEASVGMCLAADQAPQGTVMIASTQPQVKGI